MIDLLHPYRSKSNGIFYFNTNIHKKLVVISNFNSALSAASLSDRKKECLDQIYNGWFCNVCPK